MIERSWSCSCKGNALLYNLRLAKTFPILQPLLKGELSLSSVELSSLTEVVLNVLNKQTVLSNKFVEALSHPLAQIQLTGG